MFEQDYILRVIKEMVRMLLKILFHIDTDAPTIELLAETQDRENLYMLLELVDKGDVNEAENRIFELLSDNSMSSVKTALLFYSYLNDRTDDFLEKHDFSREEIRSGLQEIISRCGLDGLADIFIT